MTSRLDFFIFNVGGNDSNYNAPSPPNPNKVLCFNTAESDEEIVYNSAYKPNLSIDILINNSDDSRLVKRNKKKGTKDVPRPQNAWIIYRKDKSVLPEFEGLKSSLISKEAAVMWNNESNVVREYFAALSRLAEKRHIEKYGKDYKYRPKKSKVKQNKERQAVENRKAKKAKQQPTPTTSNINSPVTSSSSSEFEQIFPSPITSNSDSPVISLLEFEGQSTNISEEQFFSPLSDITRSPSNQSQLSLEFEQSLSELMDMELFSTYTLMTEFEQPSPNLNLSELTPPTTVEQPSQNLSELMTDEEFFSTLPIDFSELIMNAEDFSIPSFTTPPPFVFEESSSIPPIQDNISLDPVECDSSVYDLLELQQQQQQFVDWSLYSYNELASFGQSELNDQSAILLYEPSL